MANIYVNHTGSATPPYNTEAKAAKNIQVALDAAAEGDTVWIKADQNYVMNGTDQQTAQFDVDHADGVVIKGYYLSPGDQDYGGVYYKDPTHGWVVINANNGGFNVFVAGAKNNLHWHNLKTINVNTSYTSFYCYQSSKCGYLIQNCWTTGGAKGIYGYVGEMLIQDCKFTGIYSDGSVYSDADAMSMIIESCEFAHGAASYSIYGYMALGSPLVICNNIFNISGTVPTAIYVRCERYSLILVTNNTIYENSGGTITCGIDIANDSSKNAMIFNNIIVGCTTSINDAAGINFGGWNCFYNNGSNWTLRDGDIVADPQFMDAANGDFRLKPTSSCLNTGKPTLGGGYTSIGTWQRKSLLG